MSHSAFLRSIYLARFDEQDRCVALYGCCKAKDLRRGGEEC